MTKSTVASRKRQARRRKKQLKQRKRSLRYLAGPDCRAPSSSLSGVCQGSW